MIHSMNVLTLNGEDVGTPAGGGRPNGAVGRRGPPRATCTPHCFQNTPVGVAKQWLRQAKAVQGWTRSRQTARLARLARWSILDPVIAVCTRAHVCVYAGAARWATLPLPYLLA